MHFASISTAVLQNVCIYGAHISSGLPAVPFLCVCVCAMAVHIAQTWDRDDDTRERLRNSGRLLLVAGDDGAPIVLGPSDVIPKSVANVRLNIKSPQRYHASYGRVMSCTSDY